MERWCEMSSQGGGKEEFSFTCLTLAGGLTSYPQGQPRPSDIIYLNFLTRNEPQKELTPPYRSSAVDVSTCQALTLLSPRLPSHQVCSLPCTLSRLLVTATLAFAALMPSTPILTLVLFLLHPPVPKPNCLLLMSSWLPAYGFFITHPFNPIGNICCCQLPLLLKTFSWLPGAPLSSVSFMLFKNCFLFSALLVPLPLLSVSLFKCWYLPCSVLVSDPFSSLLSWGVIILPMILHIASAIHISFPSFLSTMLLHRKLSFVLQKSVQKPPPLGCLCWHQRQSWVRPTLFCQNNVMICFRVWYPHSEWET